MTETVPPAAAALARMGIPFRLFTHSGPVESLAQAAAERGQRPEQVVRSILFRLEKDEYALALVAGPAQLSWKALRRHFGRSRLTMASPSEVLTRTGSVPGAVSPFGLPHPLPLVVDASVFREAEISLGSGTRGAAVILSAADFRRALAQTFGVWSEGEFTGP